MFKAIKKIFEKDEPLRVQNVKLGSMIFDQRASTWETDEGDIFHSVPGDNDGPSESAIDFVVNKLNQLEKFWQKCQSDLEYIAHSYDTINKSDSAKKIFKVSALSVNSADHKEWEICFESFPEYKWLYVGMHFSGEELVANDIST
ncbi:hypothetical protein [Microbulbifer agarilyticus]|uniref:hypothetical protein n=1 Tax=Microbulbifer agarilyticus TaxID=260552 RepID=UPI001C9772C2|nr:hypothetical protein [Microbulbifer agarilyticus]MBY6212840.1 hypothetical protein [Microbulbifer agarilyticus]MCA0894411.1 hypothetical protein [Microbulbifer agarilyticus]